MTWHSNFSVISVNLMWIRISTKEFLKSHHTDRQPLVQKLMIFIPPAFMPRVYSFRLDVCPFVCSFVCSFVRYFPSRS